MNINHQLREQMFHDTTVFPISFFRDWKYYAANPVVMALAFEKLHKMK